MKNSTRIKVVKRRQTPARPPDASNTEVKTETSSEKTAARDLANQVNDWVSDLRKKKQAEERRLAYNFFPGEAPGS